MLDDFDCLLGSPGSPPAVLQELLSGESLPSLQHSLIGSISTMLSSLGLQKCSVKSPMSHSKMAIDSLDIRVP